MNLGRWTSMLVTLAMVVVVAVLVAWLRATAPTSPTDVSVRDQLPTDEPLTCDVLEADEPDPTDEAAPTGEAATDDVAGLAVSSEVLACPFAFDGLHVTYIGEVVGDVLARDGGSWLLVNDDTYALESGPLTAGGTPDGTNSGLAVWLPDPLDELVDEPGRAGRRGDVLHVTGRVNRADPADGGGLTIRAEEAEVLAEAATLDQPIHWRQVGVAAVLGVLALVALWREREQRDR